MALGQKIELVRTRNKMSQAELGKLSGVNGDIVGKYERGEMKPSIETVKKLADALKVSLDYLVGDGELKVPNKKTSKRLYAKGRGHLLALMDALLFKCEVQRSLPKGV